MLEIAVTDGSSDETLSIAAVNGMGCLLELGLQCPPLPDEVHNDP
jgi:hypothetical protein